MKKLIAAYATSELYVAGRTEDGVEYTAERYLVQAEYDNGARIQHEKFFNGCETHTDPDEGYTAFVDVREAAGTAAKKLAERVDQAIKDGLALNMDYWHEARPVYGSAAFSNADEVQWEREQRELGN